MNDDATLFEIADELLEYADEDEERLVHAILKLAPGTRSELLTSDFLNAYQVYLYLFREIPDELIIDRLLLEPASALQRGVLLEEIDLVDLYLLVKGEMPVIQVRIQEEILATFQGRDSHHLAIRFAEEYE
ncbi:hypothetical protein FTO68_01715 [Methanocalculus taiwanensis]|uniref:Uncharacterized protein n=1 Tax=Methanocalculus taiwanensis TaxID=106207 RepID=A0ABD4TFE8_9EURY|nr:hypothetical protein [Methanocalculus taiwanensis]MCQ1537709.1 hypothetical protein [Methanocalculus taiwanensis]